MEVYVGDIVKNEVTRSGKAKTQIATDIGLSRQQLYNLLEKDYMDADYVIKIGKSIRYDFTDRVPELLQMHFAEEAAPYRTLNSGELREELLDLQRRYIRLQENHIQILYELRQYERKEA